MRRPDTAKPGLNKVAVSPGYKHDNLQQTKKYQIFVISKITW